MDSGVGGWVGGWVDRWINGWMDGRIRVGRKVDGCKNGFFMECLRLKMVSFPQGVPIKLSFLTITAVT